MAVEDQILGVTEADGPDRLDAIVTHMKMGVLGTGSGYVLAGTPLARRSSGIYEPWSQGRVLQGFVIERTLLDAVDEELCPVMLRGEILYTDVVLSAGVAQDDLDQALRTMRQQGLAVHGLPDADQVKFDNTLNALVPNFISAGSQVFNPTVTHV